MRCYAGRERKFKKLVTCQICYFTNYVRVVDYNYTGILVNNDKSGEEDFKWKKLKNVSGW